MKRTHGHAKKNGRQSPEYGTWIRIKDRCYNEKNSDYHNYGGRGITVDPAWIDSFETFYSDMGERPPGLSIERKDNNGNYGPKNCIWATAAVQSRNKRVNRMITYKGETLCLMDWVTRTGLPRATLKFRLTHGWDIERALTEPADSSHDPYRTGKELSFNGETMNIAGWSRRTGIGKEVLQMRTNSGWSVEKTLTTPLLRQPKKIEYLTLDADRQLNILAAFPRNLGLYGAALDSVASTDECTALVHLGLLEKRGRSLSVGIFITSDGVKMLLDSSRYMAQQLKTLAAFPKDRGLKYEEAYKIVSAFEVETLMDLEFLEKRGRGRNMAIFISGVGIESLELVTNGAAV